jgi:hypothetical protein
MTEIEVTARFAPTGEVTVLRFVHANRPVEVSDSGRQWRDEAGLHVLVMSGNQVYELVFDPQAGSWSLRERPHLPRTV